MTSMVPLTMAYNNEVASITAKILGAIVLLYLLWGLAGRERRFIVPAMLLAGAVTALLEPLADVASGCLHPMVGQQGTVFTLMGRSIPFWVIEAYALLFGGFGSLNLLALNRGITRRAVWLWFLAPLLGDVLMEQTFLHFHLYTYYGNQPLQLYQFPLYQPAGNSCGELLGVMTLFFLRRHLEGFRWFAAALIVLPLADAMGFVLATWPSDYAVYSSWPSYVVQSCGILTWGIAALLVYAVSNLVGTDSPLRKSGHLQLA